MIDVGFLLTQRGEGFSYSLFDFEINKRYIKPLRLLHSL